MDDWTGAESLDLRTLRMFVAVVEEGSMTAAGARMGLTQSAVSQAMGRLARQVGVALLRREGRQLAATPGGQVLAERAGRLLADAQALPGAAREAAHEPEAPHVRLGFIDSFASTAAPGLIKRLLDDMPRVRLLAWSGLARAQGEALLRRRLDAVITCDPMDEVDGLARHELLREPYILLLPSALVESCAGLGLVDIAARHPLVRHSARSHTGGHIERHLRRLGVAAPRMLEFDTAEAVIAMVAGGIGWAVTTPLCLLHGEAHLAGAVPLALPAPGFSRRLYLIGQADADRDLQRRLTASARAVLAAEVLPRLAGMAPWLADAVVLAKPGRAAASL